MTCRKERGMQTEKTIIRLLLYNVCHMLSLSFGCITALELLIKLLHFQKTFQGPVVQSIVSLMTSLRGQLIKCFMTLQPNKLIFFVEKMREAFALQKLLTLFQQKLLAYIRY